MSSLSQYGGYYTHPYKNLALTAVRYIGKAWRQYQKNKRSYGPISHERNAPYSHRDPPHQPPAKRARTEVEENRRDYSVQEQRARDNWDAKYGKKSLRGSEDKVDSVSNMPYLAVGDNIGRNVWRPKRESRKHKRSRIRAVKNAEKAAINQSHSIVVTKATQIAVLNPLINTQAFTSPPALYSFAGNSGNEDILDLARNLNIQTNVTGGVAGAPTLPSNDVYDGRLHFIQASQFCEITNNEAVNAFVDVYHYKARADIETPNMISNLTVDPPLTGNTALLSTNLAWTPFQASEFVAKCKVTKKQMYELGPGQSVNFTHYGRKGVYNLEAINGIGIDEQVGLKGWTQGIIVVACGRLTATTEAAAMVAGVSVLTRNRYVVKFVPNENVGEINTFQSMIIA